MSTECDRFGRYLTGAPPDSYVRGWYERGHEQFPEKFAAETRLDRVLLAMSRRTWIPLRAVDVTARHLAPGSAVRRKLVFLTALFENAPGTHSEYEAPVVRSGTGFFLGLAGRGIVSGAALLAGLILVTVAMTGGAGRRPA